MEHLLHYVWKHKLFPLKVLQTTNGLPVEVIDSGLQNPNAGPDFFNAKLKIDGALWVGNIEIHTHSSDWFRHGHDCDKAYDSVILHVVSEADTEITRTNGEQIPQLLLTCPENVQSHYHELCVADHYPACYPILASLPKLTIHSWLTALQTERLEQKAQLIMQRLELCNNNWDDFESEAFKSADVAIEFTNPMVAYSNYMKAFKAGVKLVSGSTGWMAEHGEEIKKLCTEGGKTLFWSSNFSLGVSIFSALNKYLAKIMNQFPAYDVTMSETHHIHKLDAPSGTAITLAEGILEKLDRKDKWVKGTFLAPDGTISGTNDCAPNELPIASIREGEVFGLHTIRYESDVDSITITHDAKSRGGFVLGAVLAAEYTATHEGFLGMSDLFPFLND